MEIKEMSMTDVEIRAAEIEKEMSAQDADIEKLSAEVDELEKRKAEIIKDAEERKQQLDEIKANDFNLNIPRYVDTFEEEELIDIEEVQGNIERIKAEIAVVEAQMAQYLKELGL